MAARAWRPARGIGLAVLLGALLAAGRALADDTSRPAQQYSVSHFELVYDPRGPSDIPLSDTEDAPIHLGQVGDVYVAPQTPGARRVDLTAGALTGTFDISALRSIDRQLAEFFNRRDLVVLVYPDFKDVNPDTGQDVRPADRARMKLVVHTFVVKELRTVASLYRIPEAKKINNPLHQWIRDHSPVKPAGSPGPAGTDLLRRDAIDEYVFSLDRQPGRRVDVAVSAAADGGVALDYLVAENRPLSFYAQLSNTGTEDTSPWRERVGFFDTQLTNHDDTLAVDYTTSSFQWTNSVTASYESPIMGTNLRWKVFGLFSQFEASDVGLSTQNFNGIEDDFGLELSDTIYHHRDLFLDAVAGARAAYYHVDNNTLGESGEATYAMPYLGLRVEQIADQESTTGSLNLVFGITGASKADLTPLGRSDPDGDWTMLQWDFSHSFFLEPIIDPEGFANRTAGKTLGHEIYFAFKGQYDFGNRLIPQQEHVDGGFDTVRGYPESLVTGDGAFIWTLEYRYHIPRTFRIQEDPSKTPLLGQPFKLAPQYTFGRPDWDLIARTFIDVGRTIVNRPETFEGNQTLVGTGVGLEFLFKQNISLRADWGVALNGVPGLVGVGDNRFHLVFTFMY